VNGASVNQNNKTEEELIGFITKKAFVERLLLEERIRVSEKDKKAVRDVMKELFGTVAIAEDEDSIMKNFWQYAQNILNEILRLELQYKNHAYPGAKVLADGKRLLQTVIGIEAPIAFFRQVSDQRDDFYDFAEDYEPVKSFFAGEQLNIFTRALDMLAIYDDSKTYIVDENLEKIVAEMRHIVKQEKPYPNIPKLPELRSRFTDAYSKILTREEKPVLDTIDQARERVTEVLNTKEYAESKRRNYHALFDEIRESAEHCNNVSALRSFADKADALKIRLLNEMDAIDRRIAEEKALQAKKEAEEAARKAKEEGRAVPDLVVKEEKTCPSGQYLNPETKRCKKFPPQKMKTCPEGYFLNVKTNRCNKNPVPKKSTQSNPKPKESTNPSPNHPDSKDQNDQTKKPAKDCLPGYFLNKITGRCNKQHEQAEKACPEGTFRNKITGRRNKIQAESQKKPCHADQYRNPKTGRCHKMAASPAPKTCPAGKVLNPVTNRCKGEEKSHEVKACKEGYERNEQTHRCRKVHQNTGASNPVEVPKLGDKKEEQKKDFNGTTAVAGSAAVGLGIAIFQFKNEIFVIIRKIFLHK